MAWIAQSAATIALTHFLRGFHGGGNGIWGISSPVHSDG